MNQSRIPLTLEDAQDPTDAVYIIKGVCRDCRLEMYLLSADVGTECPHCGKLMEVHHKSEGRFE